MNVIYCDCGNVLHGPDFQPLYCWCCGMWWYPIEVPKTLELEPLEKPVPIEASNA